MAKKTIWSIQTRLLEKFPSVSRGYLSTGCLKLLYLSHKNKGTILRIKSYWMFLNIIYMNPSELHSFLKLPQVLHIQCSWQSPLCKKLCSLPREQLCGALLAPASTRSSLQIYSRFKLQWVWRFICSEFNFSSIIFLPLLPHRYCY